MNRSKLLLAVAVLILLATCATALAINQPASSTDVPAWSQSTTVPATYAAAKANSVTVYVTETGSKYHLGSCRHLRKSKIKTTLQQAKADGYTACKVCKPPK
jgi:biopolymer transport protein ExbD